MTPQINAFTSLKDYLSTVCMRMEPTDRRQSKQLKIIINAVVKRLDWIQHWNRIKQFYFT